MNRMRLTDFGVHRLTPCDREFTVRDTRIRHRVFGFTTPELGPLSANSVNGSDHWAGRRC